ncbi:hypothetical protein ATCC90586_004396 [Pythium insidiosum]|nr:hypothetical protein ATCC90586_004396 [Pythium insidiosum]
MKMPEEMLTRGVDGRRALRAWFGKMTLLPAYQRMLQDNRVLFGTHTNVTTRYLLQNNEADLKTVGCASGRQLAPSDVKCTLRKCSLKPGATAPEEPCEVICNRYGHADDDAPLCQERCQCQDTADPSLICWMLCVPNLPPSQCPLDQQTCKKNQQYIICPSTPPPPAPTTPGPAPTTGAPSPTSGAPGPAPTSGAPGPAPTSGAPGPAPTSGAPGPAPTSGAPGPAPTSGAPAPTATSRPAC